MQQAVDIPVTVKSRIGIDEMDEYEDLTRFIKIVAESGCDTFIVHARKAWLKGLSPKENRDVPPLIYERVYHLKEEFPHLNISINGGVKSLEDAALHLGYLDGVMIGREVYSNPYLLAEVDQRFYQDDSTVPSREQIVTRMADYAEQHIAQGGRVWNVARHMLGLFQGQAGARIWRRHLSQHGTLPNADAKLLINALAEVKEAQAQAKAFLDSKVG